MIFVTVGTHEQQFNRLIEEIDRLKGTGQIADEVFIQSGFSTYTPLYCRWSKLLPYSVMNRYINEAHIVITHGGPASFQAVIQTGKIPIVVPRQHKYGEHVNDHQVEFVQILSEKTAAIISVYDISNLHAIIEKYDEIIYKIQMQEFLSNGLGNTTTFIIKLDKIVSNLIKPNEKRK